MLMTLVEKINKDLSDFLKMFSLKTLFNYFIELVFVQIYLWYMSLIMGQYYYSILLVSFCLRV